MGTLSWSHVWIALTLVVTGAGIGAGVTIFVYVAVRAPPPAEALALQTEPPRIAPPAEALALQTEPPRIAPPDAATPATPAAVRAAPPAAPPPPPANCEDAFMRCQQPCGTTRTECGNDCIGCPVGTGHDECNALIAECTRDCDRAERACMARCERRWGWCVP